jgi:hypothetical protein
MVGDVAPGLADRVVLLQTPGLVLQRRAEPDQPVLAQALDVAQDDLEKVPEAALLEGHQPVHVGLAEVQRGNERYLEIQQPAVQPQGTARLASVAEAEAPALGVDQTDCSLADDVPKKIAKQHRTAPIAVVSLIAAWLLFRLDRPGRRPANC